VEKSDAFGNMIRFLAVLLRVLNLKAKLAMRKAYGFRNVKTVQIALYHALGNLPEPEISHKFC